MKLIIKKYGRWNDSSNWQLENRKEKEMNEDMFGEFIKYAGYTYNAQYNEYTALSADKMRMTVVCVKS